MVRPTSRGKEKTMDEQQALCIHNSGDLYIVRLTAVWCGDRCTGSRIIAAEGPIVRRDLGIEGPLETSRALFDAIDAYVVESTEDVDWLEAADKAGCLTYPIGAR